MLFRCLALIAFVLAAAPAACAEGSEEYVGIWAIEQTYCGEPPASEKSPMAIAKHGYDQFETHCAFTSVEADGQTYAIVAECTVRDDVKTRSFEFTVAGDTLTFTDESGAQELVRCR